MLATTRFPTHTPDTATGRAADRLGELWDRHDGQLSDMVRAMAGSAALLGGYLDLSRSMKRSRLPRRVAEQISIAVQARLRCASCLDAHITAGLAAGLTDDDIALAVRGTASDPAVAALIAYAVAVHADPASVDDQTIATLRGHGHHDRDLLDVIGLVTLNHLTGTVNLVAGLEPEDPMNTTTRLAAYGGVLATSFAVAAGIGLAAGPIDTGGTTVHDGGHDDQPGHDEEPDAHGGSTRAGTSLDAAGFRFTPDLLSIPAGEPVDYSFRLVDGSGATVSEFATVHERDLHLIVASRDLRAYHHLHPEHDGTGTWTVQLPPLDAGTYRVFADSQPTGTDAVTLGVDLIAVADGTAGGAPASTATAGVDAYDITLTGDPQVGSAALSFLVQRDGEPVVTEPYLGAAGHLVVLRVGDLAYVHTHADHAAADHDDPSIAFDVSFPTAGTYRLFLDFAVDGTVRTADFTVQVADHGTTTPAAGHAAPDHEGH